MKHIIEIVFRQTFEFQLTRLINIFERYLLNKNYHDLFVEIIRERLSDINSHYDANLMTFMNDNLLSFVISKKDEIKDINDIDNFIYYYIVFSSIF